MMARRLAGIVATLAIFALPLYGSPFAVALGLACLMHAALAYLNDLISFSLYFFGCPATGTQAGPLTFQLIPSAFAGRTFTTADVAALSAAYSSAIAQSLSDAGAPPLKQAQVRAVNNQLAFLAGRVPHVVTSATLSASTCP